LQALQTLIRYDVFRHEWQTILFEKRKVTYNTQMSIEHMMDVTIRDNIIVQLMDEITKE